RGGVEDTHVRPAARTGAGEDVRQTVPIRVNVRGDGHSAGEAGVVGEKALQDIMVVCDAGFTGGVSVATDVDANGDGHSAGEAGVVGEKALQDIMVVCAAEDFDVRPAAGPGAGDDVAVDIAVNVAQ